MSIETINTSISSTQVDIQINSVNQVKQGSTMHSIQELKQQMQVDPSYQPTLQEKTILNAIDEVNAKIAGLNIQLEVSFHEKAKEMIVKLVDVESKQIIREIPSEKIVDMIANMCEMAGLYVDEKK